VEVERDVEAGAESFDELLVGVGFARTDAVVDVGCAEADAERVVFCGVGGMDGEQEGYGVRAAGDGDADAVAGLDVGAIEGEGGGRHQVYGTCGFWNLV
jgi:hypothetical protein